MKIILFIISILFVSCDEYLDQTPQGELSEKLFENSEEGVEAVIIGVYSLLNGQYNEITNAHRSGPSNWVFGDVPSDDAYKGSSGISDGSDVHQIEIYETNADLQALLIKWEACFEGVSRANKAINIVNNFNGWDDNFKAQRIAELKVLRGHYYFELKKIYNKIPYFDETVTPEELKSLDNKTYSSAQIWEFIENDFREAAVVLPDYQSQVGRITGVAARAYLAKTLLYQQKWSEAWQVAQSVVNNPGNNYLMDNFDEVFLIQLNSAGAEFCPECIFSVQHSLDESLPSSTSDVGQTFGWDGNVGDRLSGLGGPYPRVYGFHRPSQNLVNAYKTSESGLPLLSSFNNADLNESDMVDPRLDHTVGRPGIPFLDAGEYKDTWTRGVSTYGVYSPKKQLYPVNSDQYMNVPYFANMENFCLIRMAEIYLIIAESAIELGDLETARQNINIIRNRAKNGRYVQSLSSNEDAGNYNIEEYTEPFSDVESARLALRMERRLELALEGHRFFDLVRWGIASEILNKFLEKERNKRSYLNIANFKTNVNEYFPIPSSEIDISEGRLLQNPGY